MSQIRSRFGKDADRSVQKYTSSIAYDRRLYREDIAGSVAHARMLAKQSIISDKDAELIIMALVSIREEIEQGKFQFKDEMEDIHMNIEARLVDKIGEPGQRLHTARSRNDQVALDMRLYVKRATGETLDGIKSLQKSLIALAEANSDTVLPGYTHMQQAQPVLLAHHLLAYFEMLQRDTGRFQDCLKRADVMPLGSGALAGVPYPLDRQAVAKELGFSRISANSMDAVSDRDFIIEYQSAAATAMMHLSRLSEEMIIWSSAEFGFIEIDDAYATGSSIMPQKKNPDVAELARGRTGKVYGNLLGILTVLKGLPLTYNRDLQEDKEGLFQTVDTLNSTLEVFAGMVGSLKVRPDRMRHAAEGGYLLATDLADYLVRNGLPFRKAHEAVARLVQYAVGAGKDLKQLSLDEYHRFSPLFKDDVFQISATTSIAARNVPGGTAQQQVKSALAEARATLEGKHAS